MTKLSSSSYPTQSAEPPHQGAAPLTNRAARPAWLRIAALLVASAPITCFLIARQLEPSARGLGTHQQLGLPPCSFRVLFQTRCPSCGMTTSWAYFTRFQWLQSAQVNTGGFLLALLSSITIGLAAKTCWTAKLPSYQTQRSYGAACLAIAAITLVDWIARII